MLVAVRLATILLQCLTNTSLCVCRFLLHVLSLQVAGILCRYVFRSSDVSPQYSSGLMYPFPLLPIMASRRVTSRITHGVRAGQGRRGRTAVARARIGLDGCSGVPAARFGQDSHGEVRGHLRPRIRRVLCRFVRAEFQRSGHPDVRRVRVLHVPARVGVLLRGAPRRRAGHAKGVAEVRAVPAAGVVVRVFCSLCGRTLRNLISCSVRLHPFCAGTSTSRASYRSIIRCGRRIWNGERLCWKCWYHARALGNFVESADPTGDACGSPWVAPPDPICRSGSHY